MAALFGAISILEDTDGESVLETDSILFQGGLSWASGAGPLCAMHTFDVITTQWLQGFVHDGSKLATTFRSQAISEVFLVLDKAQVTFDVIRRLDRMLPHSGFRFRSLCVYGPRRLRGLRQLLPPDVSTISTVA